MTQKIGILGYGEIGQAIAKFYKKPSIKDLDRNDGLKGIKILHICIPYDKNFVKTISKEIKKIKPKLVIIHSTVAPGTTKKIIEETKNKMIIHSPIRGIHPHLYQGIKTFVKYIGAENKKAGEMAKKHLNSLGIKTEAFYPAKTTELGKLFDTTYYALCVAWHGEMKEICDKEKVNFEKVATDFNKTYNEGYKKLKMNHVVRPVLKPPEKFIGGHCLIPNTEILKNNYKSLVFDLILKYKNKKE